MDLLETIKISAQKIGEKILAKEIILFGSYADGIQNDESDIDLCFITGETNKRKIDIIRDIRKELFSQLSSPMDILVYSEKEFEERAELKNTFENTILNRGIKLLG